MARERCKHPGCNCPASESRRDGYCSDACRDEQETAGRCECGHPDCE
ncbi:MAG TPA: hypothetical protein VNF72_14135 [Myxococcota bacterium]|nr:hypothetical protein [Myxococcota bacterium]